MVKDGPGLVSLPLVPGEEGLVFLSCRKTSAAQRDELAVGSGASEPAMEENCLLPWATHWNTVA